MAKMRISCPFSGCDTESNGYCKGILIINCYPQNKEQNSCSLVC